MLKRQVLLFFFIVSFVSFMLVHVEAEKAVASPEFIVSEWNVLDWEKVEGSEVHLFVNSEISSKQKKIGTEKAPFKTIDEALSHVNNLNKKDKKMKVLLNIKGKFTSAYSYIISCPIKIVGVEKKTKATLEFGKNAGFMLSSSFLELENISITRKEGVGEPRTVPLFYSSSGKMKLNAININAKEGGSVFVFRFSTFEMDDVCINSKQGDYCTIMEIFTSKGKISSSKFTSISKSSIALDVDKSDVLIDGLLYDSSSSYFSFFMRAFSSKLHVANTTLTANANSKEGNVAIIHNKDSQLKEEKVVLSGFAKLAEVRNSRLDYMK